MSAESWDSRRRLWEGLGGKGNRLAVLAAYGINERPGSRTVAAGAQNYRQSRRTKESPFPS
jgi:hypothetical protein